MAATISRLTVQAPFQSSKLLLSLASTVILNFEPSRDPWPNLCSFQDRLCVRKWGLLFDDGRGLSFWVSATFVAGVYPHSRGVQVRAFVLYGHHTRYVSSLQWTLLMQDIHRASINAGFFSGLCFNLFYNSETAVSHLDGRRPGHRQVKALTTYA
jgi:hypothetical protein